MKRATSENGVHPLHTDAVRSTLQQPPLRVLRLCAVTLLLDGVVVCAGGWMGDGGGAYSAHWPLGARPGAYSVCAILYAPVAPVFVFCWRHALFSNPGGGVAGPHPPPAAVAARALAPRRRAYRGGIGAPESPIPIPSLRMDCARELRQGDSCLSELFSTAYNTCFS